jgi:hypothetical protein
MHVLMVAMVMSAGPVEPRAGTYIFEGGAGSLVLAKGTFSIEVVGANAHTCNVSGSWKGASGLANEEGEKCELSFAAKGDEVTVTSTGEACRSYCGARASFDGLYLTPKKGCTRAEVKKTRAAFKAAYDKKQYAQSVSLLAPLLDTCVPVLDRFDVMWIRNDLAIAQHRAGDDQACLSTLEPVAEYRDAPPGEPIGYEPSFEDVFARIAKATRTNAKLCGFVAKPAK